ncbi:hypothetical protein FQN57_001573 [Myotisia sp. PD_48]|nr:hypothetical protein FQN57_001573 [Myotisia sp. PD_48]
MTDKKNWLPINPETISAAHLLIRDYIHETPVLTCKTLNELASTPQQPDINDDDSVSQINQDEPLAQPRINFFFKCENFQRIGAFKVRGAFHSILRLITVEGLDEVKRRGVITHSSGNHAQAVALAAFTLDIPSYIVMPSISVPSKIEATKVYNPKLYFSGPTTEERESVVARIKAETNAFLIHPYDHPDTIIGQGTAALEMEQQVNKLCRATPNLSCHVALDREGGDDYTFLDAVVTPVGGGGLQAGTATFLCPHRNGKKIYVFGSEPSFQGADDVRRGLLMGERITRVKSLTIADGLRTPIGELPFGIVTDANKCRGVFAVTENQIKKAMKLVIERMKILIEPSAAVPLAACLYNEEFRQLIEREGGERGWNIGIIFSGGNTTIKDVSGLFTGISG